MSFIDEGKLRIHDTIGKFLPMFTAAGKGNITIGQCLSHTTGIQSGKSFSTLFREKIAGPCEMTNTDFRKAPVPIAAGSAFSTPADYLRLLQMIVNNGNYKGKTVLKKEIVALMQHNYAKGKKMISSPAEAGTWGYGFEEWTADNSSGTERSNSVTSPGLFGSFPWIDNKNRYAGVLFTFYIKSNGRHERYTALKKIIDDAITGIVPGQKN